jgi:hypothetical protein
VETVGRNVSDPDEAGGHSNWTIDQTCARVLKKMSDWLQLGYKSSFFHSPICSKSISRGEIRTPTGLKPQGILSLAQGLFQL